MKGCVSMLLLTHPLSLLQPHARGHPEGSGDGRQYGDKDLYNIAPDLFVF